MKKKALVAAILLLTMVFATVSAYAFVGTFLLTPHGPVRVALRSYAAGTATWFATAPLVHDGSFSARLYTAGTADDGGGIMIGPLAEPLSSFSASRTGLWPPASQITFWAYHISDVGGYDQTHQPYINIVLDNGRVMEGLTSVPVSVPTTSVNSLANQGYPSADLWVQMKPTDQWYTSFWSSDPVLAPVKTCTLTSTCTMAFWQHAFPTAKVIQIEIVYGQWSTGGPLSICIDDVSIHGRVVPIEPEVIAATP
jgi:hypothetical protein